MTGDTLDKIKRGLKGTAEGVKEGVEETAEGVKDTAEVTDSDTYVDTKDESEVTENKADGKEPMNPDDISKHEPTAVKRDRNQGTSGDAV
jgi:hypothetical protein